MKLHHQVGRHAMHAAIARLDRVLENKVKRGEALSTPHNNLSVWRTQMRITMVKATQTVQKVLFPTLRTTSQS